MRVARSWGDTNAIKQVCMKEAYPFFSCEKKCSSKTLLLLNSFPKVAYAWAISRGGKNGLEAVAKLGFLNEAIEYAVDVGAFNNAFHLCSAASTEKLEKVCFT